MTKELTWVEATIENLPEFTNDNGQRRWSDDYLLTDGTTFFKGVYMNVYNSPADKNRSYWFSDKNREYKVGEIKYFSTVTIPNK